MRISKMIRLSGLATIVGGVLFPAALVGIFLLLENRAMEWGSLPYLVLNAVALLANILILMGVVGLYARQAGKTGALGLIAFLLTFAGWALVVGAFWTFAFVSPTVAWTAPHGDVMDRNPLATMMIISFATGGMGWLLFGLASFLARELPRWAPLLLIVGDLFRLGWALSSPPNTFPLGDVVFGLGVAAMGYALWSELGEPALFFHRRDAELAEVKI